MSEAPEVNRKRYSEIVALANKQEFAEAKGLLEDLIQDEPEIAAYYLTLSQLQMQLGEKEASVNSIFRAIELEPDNAQALKLMAERQLSVYNNKEEARKYYGKLADKGNRLDNVTNIALDLVRHDHYDLAMEYFEEVINARPNDPVVSYSIAYMSLKGKEYREAFDNAIMALGQIKQFNDLYSMAFDLAVEAAEALRMEGNYEALLKWFAGELETEFKVPIQTGIKKEVFSFTWALEGTGDEAKYLLEYNDDNPGSIYMALQKLAEYHMQQQGGNNTPHPEIDLTPENRQAFSTGLGEFIKRALAAGYTDNAIQEYIDGLYLAVTSQAYLTPTNLFIDNFLHNTFTDLQPLQFLYMCSEAQKFAESVEVNEKDELFPKEILGKSKVYFMVSALQLMDFYKVNYVARYNATEREYNQAEAFYKEYLTYKDDKEPNEEFELVRDWAQDLGLNKFFNITNL